jgi:hypothetical protein
MSAAGELALWAALLIAAWGALAGSPLLAAPSRPQGGAFSESAHRALWAAALLLAVAVAGVAAMLLTPDPAYSFTVSSVSVRMPPAYRLAAMMMRLRGELLLVACFTAFLGAFASRRAAASLHSIVCGIVLVLAGLPMITGASPYARAGDVPSLAVGIAPVWQAHFPPLARFALLVVASVTIVAAALSASGRASRNWWLAAWGLGALALVLSLRASLTGAPWNVIDWTFAGAWLVLGAWLHVRRGRAGLSAHLVHAGAIVALAALVGLMMRADHRIVLEGADSAALKDPFGSEWRFTSEGLSIYDERNRQAAVVLVTARQGAQARHERVEYRQYIDDNGAPLGGEVRVAGLFPGVLASTVIAFSDVPEKDRAPLLVRFVPLFALWWAAALLMLAGAFAGIRPEASA